jgi:disease resistance protein RPM1
MMTRFIKEIGTPNLTNEVVNGSIEEMQKIAHHVEDVLDRYSYHTVQLADRNDNGSGSGRVE